MEKPEVMETENGSEAPNAAVANMTSLDVSDMVVENTGEFAGVFKCEKCSIDFTKQDDFVSHLKQHLLANVAVAAMCSDNDQVANAEGTSPEINVITTIVESDSQTITTQQVLVAAEAGQCDVVMGTEEEKGQESSADQPSVENPEAVKMFKCGTCEKSFKRPGHLVAHERVHTGEKPFQCEICGKCFSRASNLKPHLRSHTGEKPFECETCGKRCSRSNDLTRHKRIHTGEKPFSCTDCGKLFSHKGDLVRHERTHTGERPFSCKECGKSFVRTNDLARHHFKAHKDLPSSDNGNLVINEPELSKSDGKENSGEISEKTEKEEGSGNKELIETTKRYSCTECGRTFKRSSHLVAHCRVHSGEKPFDCKICGKRFSRASNLTPHMRSHTGEKPYACDVCGKRCTRSNDLSRHKRIHTGEKPHECATCGRKFAHSGDLVRHLRTHTGEKPYHCEICDKVFARTNDLARHRRIHASKGIITVSVEGNLPTQLILQTGADGSLENAEVLNHAEVIKQLHAQAIQQQVNMVQPMRQNNQNTLVFQNVPDAQNPSSEQPQNSSHLVFQEISNVGATEVQNSTSSAEQPQNSEHLVYQEISNVGATEVQNPTSSTEQPNSDHVIYQEISNVGVTEVQNHPSSDEQPTFTAQLVYENIPNAGGIEPQTSSSDRPQISNHLVYQNITNVDGTEPRTSVSSTDQIANPAQIVYHFSNANGAEPEISTSSAEQHRETQQLDGVPQQIHVMDPTQAINEVISQMQAISEAQALQSNAAAAQSSEVKQETSMTEPIITSEEATPDLRTMTQDTPTGQHVVEGMKV